MGDERGPKGRLVSWLARAGAHSLLTHGWQVFPCVSDPEAEALRASLDADIEMAAARAVSGYLAFQPGAHGSGHWPSVWRARIAAHSVFASMFGEDAVHSFDGFAYRVGTKRKAWWHIDQAFACEDAFDSVQGVLALSDTPPGGYTTTFCHCSDVQMLVTSLRRAFPERSSNCARVHFFSEREVAWLLARSTIVQPSLRRGDLLLWCSGLPHCAVGGGWERRGVYCSAIPRSLCSGAELVLRRQAADTGLTSTHDVVCRGRNGTMRASLKGGDQTWPKPPFPPFLSYAHASTPQQRQRARMLGFELELSPLSGCSASSSSHRSNRGSSGGSRGRPGEFALALLDGLIRDVACDERCDSTKGLAIVTGANRGLGLGIARQLASDGYAIMAVCRSRADGAECLASLACASAHTCVVLDLAKTTPEEASQLVCETVEVARARAGRQLPLTLLVNNAGCFLDAYDEGAFAISMRVNALAPLAIATAVLPLMEAGGLIINVSSGYGRREELSSKYARALEDAATLEELTALRFDGTDKETASTFKPTYKISKAALNRGTQLLASLALGAELRGERGSCYVTAVCPGWCRTRLGGKAARRTVEQGVASVLWPLRQPRVAVPVLTRDGHNLAW